MSSPAAGCQGALKFFFRRDVGHHIQGAGCSFGYLSIRSKNICHNTELRNALTSDTKVKGAQEVL
jgi:hypothetical protein